MLNVGQLFLAVWETALPSAGPVKYLLSTVRNKPTCLEKIWDDSWFFYFFFYFTFKVVYHKHTCQDEIPNFQSTADRSLCSPPLHCLHILVMFFFSLPHTLHVCTVLAPCYWMRDVTLSQKPCVYTVCRVVVKHFHILVKNKHGSLECQWFLQLCDGICETQTLLCHKKKHS